MRSRPEQTTPPAAELPVVQGFEVTTPRRRWSTKALKAAGWTVAALVVVVGFRGGFIAHPAASTTTAAQLDPSAARVAAATFTADYLAHDPAGPAVAGQDVLRRDVAAGGDPVALSWTGAGAMAADVVTAGAVTAVDGSHAVVAVQARVTLGRPVGEVDHAPPAGSQSTPPGRPAAAATLPDGFTAVSTQWLPLLVPVVATDTGVVVDSAGPVFSADPPLIPAGPAAPADSPATAGTRDWVHTVFTGYGYGSTTGAYLTVPGVNLLGLSGAVTVDTIPAWSLSNPAADGTRTGTARVGWTFAPAVDLATTQNYHLSVRSSDDRWYVTGLGTAAGAGQ